VFCAGPARRYPEQGLPTTLKEWVHFVFFDTKVFTKPAQRILMAQPAQQRRRLRRTRYHSLWITFDRGVQSFECQVLDISTGGAKLVAEIDAPIGTTFRLSAAPQAVVRRRCEIVWRKGRTIGVKFVPETAKAK
jgi:hypothetical protein